MKRFTCFLLITCMLISISACGASSTNTKKNYNQKEKKKFLFIGNSLTFVNDLPSTFKKLAKSGGYDIDVEQSSAPDYSLTQHADPTDIIGVHTIQNIKNTKWDYVILQEQSEGAAYPASRIIMYNAARKLDKLIKQNGSKTAFFMTWGYRNGDMYNKNIKTNTFEGMQEQIRIGYTNISKELSALLIPVGMAWAKAKTKDPNIDLWDTDSLHPNIEGTYLSCCVFYVKLLHKSPVGVKYYGGLTAKKAKWLQNIAYETCK